MFVAIGPFFVMNEYMALDIPWKAESGRTLEIISFPCFNHVAAGQQATSKLYLRPSFQPNFLPVSEIRLNASKQGQARWLK